MTAVISGNPDSVFQEFSRFCGHFQVWPVPLIRSQFPYAAESSMKAKNEQLAKYWTSKLQSLTTISPPAPAAPVTNTASKNQANTPIRVINSTATDVVNLQEAMHELNNARNAAAADKMVQDAISEILQPSRHCYSCYCNPCECFF